MKIIYTNNKNKFFIWGLAIMCVVSLGIFMQGCSQEDDWLESSINQHEEYLTVSNFDSKTVFSGQEKTVLKEAMNRVKWATYYGKNGFVVTKTASELNMDEGIYNVMKDIVLLANDQNLSIKPRLKPDNNEFGADVNPCDLVQSQINDYLYSHPGGAFSSDCFNHYWEGSATPLILTSDRFSDIRNYAAEYKATNIATFNSGGQTYYQGQVSFYGTPYELSFGTATITYNSQGQPVGIQDTYNFDARNDRDLQSEIKTEAVNIAGTLCGAHSYYISYGTIFPSK